MKSKKFRFLAVIVSLAIIASAVFFAREEAGREQAGEAEYPTALGKHLEKLKKLPRGLKKAPPALLRLRSKNAPIPPTRSRLRK